MDLKPGFIGSELTASHGVSVKGLELSSNFIYIMPYVYIYLLSITYVMRLKLHSNIVITTERCIVRQ